LAACVYAVEPSDRVSESRIDEVMAALSCGDTWIESSCPGGRHETRFKPDAADDGPDGLATLPVTITPTTQVARYRDPSR
jgi:hypothetical protein